MRLAERQVRIVVANRPGTLAGVDQTPESDASHVENEENRPRRTGTRRAIVTVNPSRKSQAESCASPLQGRGFWLLHSLLRGKRIKRFAPGLEGNREDFQC